MIIEYTRYRIGPDRRAAFEQAYGAAERYLKASPHCLGYELSHCTEEPERYVLRIEWVSLEDHLQRFRHEAGFSEFFSLVRPFVSDIEEMQHYRATEIAGPGGAPPRTAE